MSKWICIKSEKILFPITLISHQTIIGNVYYITTSRYKDPNGENYHFIYTDVISKEQYSGRDLAFCNIDNFITLAEFREQQIKSVIDD
jgi:hypothetical protein